MSPLSSDNVSLDTPTAPSAEQTQESSDVPLAQQQEEPVTAAADEVSPDISTDLSTNTSTAIEPEAPAPPAVTADAITAIQAVENGSSTSPTFSPLSAAGLALPEKVQDSNETLPSEELSSTLETPAAASNIANNNYNIDIDNTTTVATTSNVNGKVDSDTDDHDSNSDAPPNSVDLFTKDS
ncbi:hypothetical protein BGW39_002542 [Mortierella sp. 14UC]|nr:hypothetical protein BGW39_002542 [Mortierella sp. 14UC]